MAEGGTTTDIVKKLHDRPNRGVIYVTGGGSLVLSDLLQVPGASATLLEARIPYAQASLASLLGAPPEHACSPETARDLAMCAFLRAQQLAPKPKEPRKAGNADDAETFGFAITARPQFDPLQARSTSCLLRSADIRADTHHLASPG